MILFAILLMLSVAPSGDCAWPVSGQSLGSAVTLAPRAPAAFDVRPFDGGLGEPRGFSLHLPIACDAAVVDVWPSGIALASRRAVDITSVDGTTRVVADHTSGPALDIQPEPDLDGAHFVAAAALVFGDWHVGVWQDGQAATVAVFRPGATRPRPLLRSDRPVLAISYLPVPDARGGTLTILQQLGPGDYRILSLPWTEEGIHPSRWTVRIAARARGE